MRREEDGLKPLSGRRPMPRKTPDFKPAELPGFHFGADMPDPDSSVRRVAAWMAGWSVSGFGRRPLRVLQPYGVGLKL